jgi:hypothetical protein
MAGAGIQSLAKFRAQMCNNRRADCHRQKYEFESGLPQAFLDRGNLSAELGNPQST